jgi:diguanylate cyclase (GGDEF)-like protein
VAARLGGEEFAVLLERATPEGARLNAEAIRVALTQAGEDGLPPVTVSVGIAGIQPSETVGEALRRADLALYKAKQQGRDRICIADFTPDQAAALQQS